MTLKVFIYKSTNKFLNSSVPVLLYTYCKSKMKYECTLTAASWRSRDEVFQDLYICSITHNTPLFIAPLTSILHAAGAGPWQKFCWVDHNALKRKLSSQWIQDLLQKFLIGTAPPWSIYFFLSFPTHVNNSTYKKHVSYVVLATTNRKLKLLRFLHVFYSALHHSIRRYDTIPHNVRLETAKTD